MASDLLSLGTHLALGLDSATDRWHHFHRVGTADKGQGHQTCNTGMYNSEVQSPCRQQTFGVQFLSWPPCSPQSSLHHTPSPKLHVELQPKHLLLFSSGDSWTLCPADSKVTFTSHTKTKAHFKKTSCHRISRREGQKPQDSYSALIATNSFQLLRGGPVGEARRGNGFHVQSTLNCSQLHAQK